MVYGSAAEKGTQNAVKKNKGGQRNNARETNGLGEPRPVTWEDVEVVKNLIERCMRMYLNKDQVVESLWEYAKIVPEFTEMGKTQTFMTFSPPYICFLKIL
ncbi:hypothetical protein L484_011446 [Morus notabilis]|uniref:Uncharacterized protein n=1 Tax=Morus notabilis TaxID=981085 RepID=W9R5H9_9ROSA|nr:hypothetical protein L484_011446 [Morus notabilis]